MLRGVEQALWSAVVENPGDLSPRRALARALPESDTYGQYLRGILGLRTEPRSILNNLVLHHRDEWWSELFSLVLSGAANMGCVEYVSCTGAQWRDHHERIRGLTPLLGLTLSNATDDLPGFISSGSFDGLVSLDLSRNRMGDAEAVALAQRQGLSSLRCLDLSTNLIDRDGLRASAASPHLRHLEYLCFTDNIAPNPVPEVWTDYDGSIVGHETSELGEALVAEFGRLPWLVNIRDRHPNRRMFR